MLPSLLPGSVFRIPWFVFRLSCLRLWVLCCAFHISCCGSRLSCFVLLVPSFETREPGGAVTPLPAPGFRVPYFVLWVSYSVFRHGRRLGEQSVQGYIDSSTGVSLFQYRGTSTPVQGYLYHFVFCVAWIVFRVFRFRACGTLRSRVSGFRFQVSDASGVYRSTSPIRTRPPPRTIIRPQA